MKYKIVFFLTFIFVQLKAEQSWTWLYTKSFSQAERELHKNRGTLFFSKENVPHFTQLIFSWNALRPKKGFYRFKVRVRDGKQKTWHQWHTIAEWGNEMQRSFLDKPSFGSQFHHVRLEMPKNHGADALCIKVEACKGADYDNLYGLFVNVSNLGLFKNESLCDLYALPSVHLKNVPLYSQMILDHPKKEALCSPTSCSMLLGYLLQHPIDPVLFAQSAHDKGLDAFGSWPFNIAHAFEACGGAYGFRVQRLPSFSSLHEMLKKKIPVVVSVRGALEGGAKEYNDGHLLVVVGWDANAKKVICHDPAFEGNENICVSYDVHSFIRAWERSRRLAYIAQKK